MIPKVVIGSNYGDEGKGIMTDYLTHKHNANLVVRFNGGAQAGHTVTLQDGTRHVFSHFSSGTLAGADTYLSKFFVVNPMLYWKEYKVLPVKPVVLVDMQCPLSTPYDMMLNQMIEDARGNRRHGSCGVGFGETIERNTHDLYKLTIQDAIKPDFKQIVKSISEEYFQFRCNQLKLDHTTNKHYNNPAILDNFLNDVESFVNSVTLVPSCEFIKSKDVIFEGAQGLLLDQDYGTFPHVTRSNTGLKNVITIAEETGMTDLEVIYATRYYFTRHGAGPLHNPCDIASIGDVVDNTNIHHNYQGSIRYAPLSINTIINAIECDMSLAHKKVNITQNLAISCLDQLNTTANFFLHNDNFSIDQKHKNDVGTIIGTMIGYDTTLYQSYGPTRTTIKT